VEESARWKDILCFHNYGFGDNRGSEGCLVGGLKENHNSDLFSRIEVTHAGDFDLEK
jgi:hypothetical protein